MMMILIILQKITFHICEGGRAMIIRNFPIVKVLEFPRDLEKLLISIENLFESNTIDWQYNYVCNHNKLYLDERNIAKN